MAKKRKRPPPDFVRAIASGQIRMEGGADVSFGEVEDTEVKAKAKRRADNKRARKARRTNRRGR